MDCIFCKIVAGEFATELLFENDHAVAFRDINPQAAVHVLVVPKAHSANISQLEDGIALAGVFALIREVAAAHTDGEFRLQFNTGPREGQSVFHTHAHILSQRAA